MKFYVNFEFSVNKVRFKENNSVGKFTKYPLLKFRGDKIELTLIGRIRRWIRFFIRIQIKIKLIRNTGLTN